MNQSQSINHYRAMLNTLEQTLQRIDSPSLRQHYAYLTARLRELMNIGVTPNPNPGYGGDQQPISNLPAPGTTGADIPASDPNRPVVMDDFFEGNWEVAYNSYRPPTGTHNSSFLNFMRAKQGDYEQQYLGQVGDAVLMGSAQQPSVKGFLDNLYGGTFSPAIKDYLTTNPEFRGDNSRRMPVATRFR